MHALCLKQDVSNINIKAKGESVEIFLISENETENIEKAISLSEKYCCNNNDSVNAKVFVYASSQIDGHIIDSIDKDQVKLSDAAKKKIENDEQFVNIINKDGLGEIEIENNFDIRRIDYISDFAIKALEKSPIFTLCKKNNEKIISILIVGFGRFGKQILKTALWYCQVAGYKLELNVIDSGIGKKNLEFDILETIRHECPEIIQKNAPKSTMNEYYDICFFKADCFNDSIDKLFITEKERLAKTQVVFVTLGSDDKNIDAAIGIRRQFDRILQNTNNQLEEKAKSSDTDLPCISTVVYDDKKFNNMAKRLKNHRNHAYNVNFIGSLREIYNYKNILENEKREKEAFKYHVEWVEHDKKLENALKNCKDLETIKKICEYYKVDTYGEIQWDEPKPDKITWFINQISDYYQFEYYRNSSVSKAIHKRMLENNFKDEFECKQNDFLCMCDICKARRKTEHMRWSAYMRVNGWRYNSNRCDRAKTHNNLVETEKLDFVTQLKD